ncbi:unnamed protein product [Cuscuta europaea]|uniref:Uncharacterized protein n=1 Tax=Cuscuta europaea TaxID=41803 RepID=A0A9P1EIA6_CUSEU|nr:unnamed protein product [Cuscuta europaea]
MVESFKGLILSKHTSNDVGKGSNDIESLLGISSSSEYSIHPPKISVNKGRKKRMISERKKAILKKRSSNVDKSDACATKDQVKKPRTCKSCGEVGFHDSRNCPNKECDSSSSS